MRIKERDEWKAAFMTPERSFEPMVMFFRLMNLPATFQTMMNKLLRDLINIGKVGSFMDNVIVETEIEEGHNELVEEILKKLEENDLYVKPEKYKWKVRKVDFLGAVLGLEGIKMEEMKMKAVLDWLVTKLVKFIQKFLGLANYYQRFIEEFAKMVKPLHKLMRKE